MFNKKWTLKYKGSIKEYDLGKKMKISPEIGQILKNRGVKDKEDAEIFINPSLDYLRDPFLMKDMKKAVDRIKDAIENNQNIWVYGDYDVDGVSSTSILCIYFDSIGYPVKYYIPNRLEEGYGINEDAIRVLKEQECDLIISVDCGITSVKEVELANELGIDIIITDHHEVQDKIPDAYAVINPKQKDCNYPFDMLCGCGVAFKIIQALTPEDEFKASMYNYLEIVTLATICDIVPLVDENRIIVKNGLRLMKDGKNIGLRELINVCGIETDKIGSSHIGFSIGPRINASGRLGYSYLGVELFTTKSKEEAMEIASLLEEKNNERQMIEAKMYQEAEGIILNDKSYNSDKVLVIAKEGWQHGVIGIVASKLTEKYYKPTILLTIEDGEATGSARSIKGFSIFDNLVNCSELLNKFGGHEQAAGLSMDSKKIETLRRKVNEIANYQLTEDDMVENISVEFELNEGSIDFNLIEELHSLEPFGMSNPSPRFIMRELEIRGIFRLGKDKNHLKLNLEKNNVYECIGFNMAYMSEQFEIGDKVDVLFQLDENNYMGNRKIQFLLKDIRMAYPKDIGKNLDSINLFRNIKPCLDSNNKISNYGKVNIDGCKHINVFDYINEKSLVIANSVNGFFKALSDISLTEYEFDINYNIIENINNKVQLIFFPYIDKIDLKRYNNIILYDYLYDIEEYSCLFEESDNECEIIKYYDKNDLIYINNIIRSIIPEREEFITLYKIMSKYKEIKINILDIKSKLNIAPIKLFAMLNVFKELDLINFHVEDENSTLTMEIMPKPSTKIDLASSKVLQGLNQLKDKYKQSY
ncbi:single-stranded-DNA-specific exonuclease RecJ [[Clostridium] bifermentans ATCC 638]|uniref:Single-stranded-DNA-specific exonuclease RecJ n=2 Tax=Paraclostridium TaxID=1849822 RepID=T4VM75_PARBF|nr:single-stranded-DNA-specific exonuclease RecJ [Paraclostridium bifermentans]EQK44814.1 single-stranded-DNA-specific exonuclease RecJ [[Clostridium] bifermentans ATCC 638] [Paraclostridium bifermentans ATCC 638 = DSM 14991]RIZ58338.1 single-stranded-DNA-specific exonuclease RecJ [Paraclostridium bifermentans]UAG17795.1 single-stranded-DNA-specific exonuclease RecJ [Paraclostridium bifermentans]